VPVDGGSNATPFSKVRIICIYEIAAVTQREDGAVGTNLFRRHMNTLRNIATKFVVRGALFARRHGDVLLLVLGIGLLTIGLTQISSASTTTLYDETRVRGAVALLFRLIEGAFGALVMVVAGLGAIIAAAMGAYRAALGMLVVAVGAFILRALVSLFFGSFDSLDTGNT
jgi:hypothetical protein